MKDVEAQHHLYCKSVIRIPHGKKATTESILDVEVSSSSFFRDDDERPKGAKEEGRYRKIT